jgi:MYXO-CTERM domain-containing protein
MKRSVIGLLLGAQLLGADAFARCQPPSGTFPRGGDTVSPNTFIWAFCAPGGPCKRPTLRRIGGAELALHPVEARDIGPGPRLQLVRYAAQAPLEPGDYEVTQPRRGSVQFRVVAAPPAPPRVPAAEFLHFEIHDGPKPGDDTPAGEDSSADHSAAFVIDGDSGMLVADVGDPDEDPLDSISGFFRSGPTTRQYFWLGWGECYSTLPRAAECTRSRVRFGTLSNEGVFSGWTKWLSVEFPGADCDARAREADDAERQKLYTFVGAVAGLGLGLVALARRRRTRSAV